MAMGLKDASEFNRWKAEMNEKDDIERLEHICKIVLASGRYD